MAQSHIATHGSIALSHRTMFSFAGATVELAAGTTLELDFDGEVALKGLSYAGHGRSGSLNAATCAFIRGAGSVYVQPKGTLLLLR